MATIKGIKAGTTTITASFTDGGVTKTASASLTVTAIAPTLTFSATSSTLTYNGSKQTIGTVSYNGDGTAYYIVQTSSTAPSASASGWTSVSNGGSITSSAATATTYYVFLKSTAGNNYTAKDVISAGNKSIGQKTPTLTFTASSSTLTYSGSAQTIGQVSYDGDGTVYYSYDNSNWTALSLLSGKASLTRTNAGTYTVYLKSNAGTNYSAISAKNAGSTKSIGTASWSLSTFSTTGPYTYSGSAQGTFNVKSPLSGTVYLSSSSISAATSYSVSVTADTATTYSPTDLKCTTYTTGTTRYAKGYQTGNSNYNTWSNQASTNIVINKATPTITLAAGGTTTYTGTTYYATAKSSMSAGTIYYGASSGATTYNISGTTTATNLTSMGRANVGTTTIYAFFRPTDTTNYNDSAVASTTVKITNKATPTITLTKGSSTYPSSATATVKGSVKGTIYYGSTSGATTYNTGEVAASTSTNLSSMTRSTAGTTTIYAYLVPSDTTNYNNSSVGSVTAEVAKGTPTLTISNGTKTTYDGSSVSATCKTNVKGTFYYGTSAGASTYNTGEVAANASGTFSSMSRTNVGTTTIYFYFTPSDTTNWNSVTGQTATAKVTNKATPTISMTNGTTSTYPTTSGAVKATPSVAGTIYYGTTSGATTYNITGTAGTASSLSSITRSEYGTTTVYAYLVPSDTTNYNNSGNYSATTSVNKRTVTITAPTCVSDTLYYNGNDQTLSSGGKCTTGGTMYYYGSTSSSTPTFSTSTWSTSNPTGKTATTYYTWYYCYVSDTTNNTGTNINTVTKVCDGKVINKATPTITLAAGSKDTYDGGTVYATAKSSMSAGTIYYGASSGATTYNISGTTTAANLTSMGRKDVGTTTIYAFFRPSDTTNYNDSAVATTTAKVINKATPSFTKTDGSTTYPTTSYGKVTASVAGTVYYGTATSSMTSTKSASANSAVSIVSRSVYGTSTVYAIFTPTDTTNYNSVGTSSSGYLTVSASVARKEATLTFTPTTNTLIYNGATQDIGTVSYDGDGKIYYSYDNSTWTETSNKASLQSSAATAATYTIYLKADVGTNYLAVSAKNAGSKAIGKATPTFSRTNGSTTYPTTSYGKVTASVAGTVYYGTATSSMTSTKSASANTAVTIVSRSVYGTSTVYAIFTPTDTTNYNSVGTSSSGYLTVSASVARKEATLTFNATSSTLTYNTSAQTIGSISYDGDGKVYYSYDNSTWTETSNKASLTRTNAATYTIYLKADVGTNYLAVSAKNAGSKAIGKATPSFTKTDGSTTYPTTSYGKVTASVAGTVYYGTATSSMSTTKSLTENTAETIVSRSTAGTSTVYAIFTPTDTTNYNSVGSASSGYLTISAVVAKKTPSYTLTGSTAEYDKGPAKITVTSTVSGTLYWGESASSMTNTVSTSTTSVDVTSRSAVGTTTIYSYFVPTDTTNYNSLGSSSSSSQSASAKITASSDATISVTVASGLTYNTSAQTIATKTGGHGISSFTLGYTTTSSATVSDVTWGTANSTTITATNAGTYYIWYKFSPDAGHSNTETGKKLDATVTIAKATPTITLAAGSKTTYDGSYVYATAKSSMSAGTIYYGASSGSTTYSMSGTTTATSLSSMGRKDVGTTTIYAFFRPTDTSNYNDSTVASTTAKVVNKATPTFSRTNGSTTYPTTSNGTVKASVAGTVYYGTATSSMSTTKSLTANTAETIVSRSTAGTSTVYAIFTPTDTTNYNSVGTSSSGYLTVQAVVAKADQSISYSVVSSVSVYCTTEATTAKTTVGTKSLTIASASGSCSEGTITYTPSQSGWSVTNSGKTLSIPEGTASGTYSVTVTASTSSSDSVNYNTATLTTSAITVYIYNQVLDHVTLTIADSDKSISYLSETTCALEAYYSSGAHKTVTADTNTSYSSDPSDIVTITK